MGVIILHFTTEEGDLQGVPRNPCTLTHLEPGRARAQAQASLNPRSLSVATPASFQLHDSTSYLKLPSPRTSVRHKSTSGFWVSCQSLKEDPSYALLGFCCKASLCWCFGNLPAVDSNRLPHYLL